MNAKKNIRVNLIHYRKWLNIRPTIPTADITILLLGLFIGCLTSLFSQPSTQQAPQVTLEGTLTMYMVTRYGDSIQAIDSYRKTTGEGEFVAFVLKTDERMDMARYLDGEELASLKEYDETKQSEFLIVSNWEVIKPFSEKDFAAQFANKRVRIIGTFFFPWAGWDYVTPVAMEYTKIEVVE